VPVGVWEVIGPVLLVITAPVPVPVAPVDSDFGLSVECEPMLLLGLLESVCDIAVELVFELEFDPVFELTVSDLLDPDEDELLADVEDAPDLSDVLTGTIPVPVPVPLLLMPLDPGVRVENLLEEDSSDDDDCMELGTLVESVMPALLVFPDRAGLAWDVVVFAIEVLLVLNAVLVPQEIVPVPVPNP
jgi:hypothetical protein